MRRARTYKAEHEKLMKMASGPKLMIISNF